MFRLVFLSALTTLIAGDCTLTCAAGDTCYASPQLALDCLNSIPFNKEWADATIDVVSQSLENFGFGALYHSTGPPYSINLDIQDELADTLTMAEAGDFATDLDFQEHVQSIFQKTIDAHTRYQKPACYNVVFVQPFAFDMRVENTSAVDDEPKTYLMRNLYTDQYVDEFNIEVDDFMDKEVLLLNGMEVTTEISEWGDTHETRSNNRGIRFNAAIRSYLYRSAMATNILPVTDLTITLTSGESFTLPWMASYTENFGNVSYCAAVPESTLPALSHRAQGSPSLISTKESDSDVLDAPKVLVHNVLHDERPDREVIIETGSEYYVSCFVQTISGTNPSVADVSRVLVMKVASFSPPGNTYQDAWTGFLVSVLKYIIS